MTKKLPQTLGWNRISPRWTHCFQLGITICHHESKFNVVIFNLCTLFEVTLSVQKPFFLTASEWMWANLMSFFYMNSWAPFRYKYKTQLALKKDLTAYSYSEADQWVENSWTTYFWTDRIFTSCHKDCLADTIELDCSLGIASWHSCVKVTWINDLLLKPKQSVWSDLYLIEDNICGPNQNWRGQIWVTYEQKTKVLTAIFTAQASWGSSPGARCPERAHEAPLSCGTQSQGWSRVGY